MVEYFAHPSRRGTATVALVASNKPDAGALGVARDAGIETRVLESGPNHESALLDLLDEQAIDLVVLGGYLRLIPGAVVRRYTGRMVNVHPALLPAFGGPKMYGKRVHEAVLASGARLSGPTVHFVDDEYDRGPIVAQWPVPVFDEDTAASLAARVLRVEHALYPRVLEALASDAIALDDDGRVRGAFLAGHQGDTFMLPGSGADLQAMLDAAIG